MGFRVGYTKVIVDTFQLLERARELTVAHEVAVGGACNQAEVAHPGLVHLNGLLLRGCTGLHYYASGQTETEQAKQTDKYVILTH